MSIQSSRGVAATATLATAVGEQGHAGVDLALVGAAALAARLVDEPSIDPTHESPLERYLAS